jgi:coenzyme F420-0:L-glutamate ligase/coenzyme F420-1:gamma-L-glutamate ligase
MTMASRPISLTLTALGGVPLVEAGDDLSNLVLQGLAASGEQLQVGDVVILAQKVVSKAEGRTIDLRDVRPSTRAIDLARETGKDPRIVQLVLDESTEILRACAGVIIVEHRLGFVAANAGIDQSNVLQDADEQHALLLPEDPDGTCKSIRQALRASTGIDVAVLIIDSIGRAWRNGTIGTAIGVSGIPGLLDMRGRPDLFGRQLHTTEVGLADELAAAASLVMGQADEGRPIVLARGVPYVRRDGNARELLRPKQMDLFR